MNRIILALALCIPSLAHAQLIIDNFSTNQAGGTEIGSVPAAVDGVRHLTPPDEFPFQTLVSAVSDGVFRCGMVGSAVTTTFATQSCTATWDGNNDGAPTIESGILGSGTPGGGLDLATGAIGIELGLTVSNAGQVEFRARNYDGSQCTLVSSQFGPNTVTVFLPFDVSGCLDANGQRPTDVRGISLTVLAKGTTVYTVAVGQVAVVPIPTYAVGGTLTGLSPGSTVTLQNNDGDDLVLDTDGPFIFPTEVIDQGNYDVNVATQPRDPLQLCTVNNGIGQVDGAPVDTIDVQCAPAFGVGGTVRSEERRVGKECASMCRSRWSPYH